jgi:hypothetical protein
VWAPYLPYAGCITPVRVRTIQVSSEKIDGEIVKDGTLSTFNLQMVVQGSDVRGKPLKLATASAL